ncbi:hypothetical protein [Actinomyces provencensis]|uniref:hypothetical protein n=1 Tax=Actinomyces provencensis TaxID=1720198 RepID=UPI001E2F4409|nr:hypothetical protein [Actinomyces provencensis]
MEEQHMPLPRNRRPNTFAILLWAVALALLVAGVVVRQLGISHYASTYANSASITDELTYYTSIIGAQYTADLGNSLLAVGALSVVIALAFQALSTVMSRRAVVPVTDHAAVGTGVGDEGEVLVELDEGVNPDTEDAAEAGAEAGAEAASGSDEAAESGTEKTVVEAEVDSPSEPGGTVLQAEGVSSSEPEPESVPELEAEPESVPEPEAVSVPESEPEPGTGDPAAGTATLPGSVGIEEKVALVEPDGPAQEQTTAAAGAPAAGAPDGGSDLETASAARAR